MSNQTVIVSLDIGSNEDLLKEFLELNPDDLKPKSIKNYRSTSNMFITWLKDHGNKHIFELNERDLMKYKKHIGNNSNLSFETKINRFNLTKRFIKLLYNLYLEEIAEMRKPIVIIQFLNNLDKKSKFSSEESNHARPREQIYMSKEEIQILLREIRVKDYQKYLMFRILLETGCRKLGVLSLNLDCNGKPIEYYLYRREVYISKGKTGKHIYYCSEDLQKLLLDYIKKRREIHSEVSEVFLSWKTNKAYTENTLNDFLKRLIPKINKKHGETVINPKLTIHTFRRTLNNFREKDMKCPAKWLTILLCQSYGNVNFNHYVDTSKGFLEQYDLYNPYFKKTNSGKEINLLKI